MILNINIYIFFYFYIIHLVYKKKNYLIFIFL